MATARSSFPIDVDLYNADEEQVLFITDDVAGQELSLEITNISDKPTSSKQLTGNASATVHHFELVFRPGTLYNNPAAVKLEGAQFELFMDKDSAGKIKPNADGTLSLYFKSKGNWTLQEGEKVVIKLNQIRAATQGGTRGTRVMLKYQNLLHAGNTKTFSGFREMLLNIVNHQGKRNIPLHVGFVGHNTVLNNGKHPNTLCLRITNSSRKNETLEPTADSSLVLVAEGGQPVNEWTLATNDQLKAMKVTVKYSKEEQQEVVAAVAANTWEIPFRQLKANEFIDIQIEKLVTNHNTGHANLYLHYENILEYWDGEFVAVVEKAPLGFQGKNVGIGTPAPEGKLTVVPARNGRGFEVLSPSAGNTHFPWMDNWNYISGKGVVFRNGSHEDKMRIDLESGNVGIGISNPRVRLDVNGQSAYSVGDYGFLNSNGPIPIGFETEKEANPISILASDRIAASEFNAFSDQRIKSIIGRSDTHQDLKTLRQFEVTDYTYIDRAAHGDQHHKKLIAQQVQAVYPQAVNAYRDFIPNIYAMSETATYDRERQQLTVTAPQAHALAQGDCVRIADDQGSHELEVREVKDARTFIVAHTRSCEQVFVYGKKVDDLLTLDYEAIAMLNLSATQDLSQQMETLRQENAALKAEVEALKMAVRTGQVYAV